MSALRMDHKQEVDAYWNKVCANLNFMFAYSNLREFADLATKYSQYKPSERSYGYGYVDENGNREGYWIEWNNDGSKSWEGFWSGDHKEGRWVRYDDDQNIDCEQFWSKGNYHGINTDWYPESKVKSEQIEWTHGSMNGKYTRWYSNGKMREEGYYVNDEKDNEWKQYYPNGFLKSVTQMNLGARHGSYIMYYDCPGQIKQFECVYVDGNRVSKKTYELKVDAKKSNMWNIIKNATRFLQ